MKTRLGYRLRNPAGRSSASIVARSVEASTAQRLWLASSNPDVTKASMLVSPRTTTTWFMVSCGPAASLAAGLKVLAVIMLRSYVEEGLKVRGHWPAVPAAPP